MSGTGNAQSNGSHHWLGIYSVSGIVLSVLQVISHLFTKQACNLGTVFPCCMADEIKAQTDHETILKPHSWWMTGQYLAQAP